MNLSTLIEAMHDSAFSKPSSRRAWIQQTMVCAAAITCHSKTRRLEASDSNCESNQLTLGFSLYGTKAWSIEESVTTLKQIGYRSLEFCLLEGFPTDPQTMSAADQKRYAKLLTDQGMHAAALMENLPLSDRDDVNATHREKLKRAAAFAHVLCPQAPPVIETVLGGSKWEQVKDRFVKELSAWGTLADAEGVTICIKPHRNNALNRPADVLWLLQQINHPRIRIVYDYSHFVHRSDGDESFTLDSTMKQLLSYAPFIHVKDAILGENNQFRFGLPGADPQMPYTHFFESLRKHDYKHSVCVEVSSQIWKQSDYDPLKAAKESYAVLSEASRKAGLGG